MKQIFEFIKYSSDKQKLRQLVQNDPAYQELDEDAYDMAVQYTGATELIVEKLMRGFSMTKEQAEETVERYKK